jgi:post-segregation antitoxin (ccd killing protein)
MNAPFGPKRPVQLELDEALVQRAEALGPSLSTVVEQALARHLAERHEAETERLREAQAYAAGSAAFIEGRGAWGEEFSTLR